MQDEEGLVWRAQRRDEGAIGRLYEEYFNRIFRYVVVRIGDKAEAEDVTQQVFLNALKSISSFKPKGRPFSAWLFRIAHNQVVDYFRRKGRRSTVPLVEWDRAAGSDPQALVEQKVAIDRLNLATRRLTEAQREVISLRFAGGLSIAEVARTMGKTEGAIKALQHSAIVALRKILLVEGFDEG